MATSTSQTAVAGRLDAGYLDSLFQNAGFAIIA